MLGETLYVQDREAWRQWLQNNHASAGEIWLIYYKKHTGRPRIAYDDAVEEALCFGWIDSIVRKLDEDRFAQKFTPRKKNSKWSELNKQRVRQLLADGKMTAAGMAKIQGVDLEPAVPPAEKDVLAVPDDVRQAMQARPPAWDNFCCLAPGYRKNYIAWITSAKQATTKARRLAEAIEKLVLKQKLGLK